MTKSFSWLLFALVCLSIFVPQEGVAQVSAYTARSLRRIQRDAPSVRRPDISLSAARGEWESFQVVVHAGAQPVSGVNLTVTPLTATGGSVIDDITLYREHYVEVTHATPTWGGLRYTNKSLGAGVYPDALIPFNDPRTGSSLHGAQYDAVPASIPANQNVVFWIDLRVPQNAAPGVYIGSYTVTSDAGTKSGTITLTVWDFVLPLRPSMQSSFSFWTGYRKQNAIELLKNKLMPKNIDPRDQAELIHDWGLNSTDLGFWSGADVSTCTMEPPPTVREVSNAAGQFRPSLSLYNYTADEISDCEQLKDDVLKWAPKLHKGGSNQLIVMIPDPELFDDGTGTGRSAVDIWSVLPLQYLRRTRVIRQAIDAKQQVWSYSALFQTEGNLPAWLIDFDPMNFRIPGWLNQRTGLNGLLYWSVDYGIYAKAGNSKMWRHGFDYVNGDQYHFPGEGTLFYPEEQAGIDSFCPSMRLKWFRDGIEDYEYVELLKKAGKGKEAMQIIAPVATGWDKWSKNISRHLKVRRKLAEAILSSSQGGQPTSDEGE